MGHCNLEYNKITYSGMKLYDCSRDGINYPELQSPEMVLYVQATKLCNASCYFCELGQKTKFDFVKLKNIIYESNFRHTIKRVAITGGEPLLNIEDTKQLLELLQESNIYITLNTNAYNLGRLSLVQQYVDEIHISKHHYINSYNDLIMGIETPDLKKLSELDFKQKIKINCVLQKGYIDGTHEIINFMENMGDLGLDNLRFISMLPLTNEAKERFVNPDNIMASFENRLNDGYLYDHDMCKCFEFMYLTKSGVPITTTIRHTMDSNYSCVKQLVYDGEFLYDGFKQNNILI